MVIKGIVRYLKKHAACFGVCCLFADSGLALASANRPGFTPAPFSDYQPILDRMPFGDAVPAPVAQAVDAATAQTEAQVQAEQQKLAQQVNMSCVNVTPDGTTAIGFTDLAAKPPVNYYLLTGASAGGWTVVDADYDEEWAQIKKDDVTITLKLGKGLIDAPPARAPATVQTIAAPSLPPLPPADPSSEPRIGAILRPSQAGRPPVPNIAPQQMDDLIKIREEVVKLKESGGDLGSYMERLRERRRLEKEDKAAAEQAAREKLQVLARKITQEELAKKEREMNLSLIEQGAKPISNIELTPEEDAALVDKGVLK